jgi:hypothetical protein
MAPFMINHIRTASAMKIMSQQTRSAASRRQKMMIAGQKS